MSKKSEDGVSMLDGWTKVFDKRFEPIKQLELIDY